VIVAHDGEPGGPDAVGASGAAVSGAAVSGAAVSGAAGSGAAVSGAAVRALDGPWTVVFGDEPSGEAIGVALPHRWEDIPGRLGYSGSARYDTSFPLDEHALRDEGPARDSATAAVAARRITVSFGDALPTDLGETDEVGIRGASFRAHVTSPVGAVARVSLNGEEAGFVWAPPYELDVTTLARPGSNQLTIEVFNTGANALHADTALPAAVAAVTARYGRRFELQDVELALDGLSSGLLQPPVLRIH
jgi:hypothetical protein